jgi:hypothetical protein
MAGLDRPLAEWNVAGFALGNISIDIFRSLKVEAISRLMSRFVSGHGFRRAATGRQRLGLQPLRGLFFARAKALTFSALHSARLKVVP